MIHAAALLLLPYPPSANRYWRVFRNRVVESAEAKAYCRDVAMAFKGGMIDSAPVSLKATLHPKLTKAGVASKTRIDLDNALKVAIDALNHLAYADDSQIVRIVAEVGGAIEGGGLSVVVEEVA